MLVSDFDYHLPIELIAQEPLPERDASRMLVLERTTGKVHDVRFRDIGQWLRTGDLLVLNDTRVIPARVFGRLPTGSTLEFLLLRQLEPGVWETLTRPARKARPGTVVTFKGYRAQVLERKPEGMRVVRFEPADIADLLGGQGQVALPPYIRKQCEDYSRYQTVYARVDGAVAAPTAGLHFTPATVDSLKAQGVEIAWVTLHAGLGTFRPVKVDEVEKHTMHPEQFELPVRTAEQVNRALAEGRRIVGVGTTTVRLLESQATGNGQMPDSGHQTSDVGKSRVEPGKGETNLYIYPGYAWRIVGAMLTNFHLPKSTLLMLVSAFAGREPALRAYQHAIEQRYRFYSFGDAMLVV
jgi:S-adenosylmethionine:tRNA ribosyltransferase-isomerase